VARAADPRLSFDLAAQIYDEIRPAYPSALVEDLFRMLPPRPSILEVGPGTGQATADLLRRGAAVHAIEIGPSMAAKLRANLPSDELQVTIGDFEQVPIPDRSMDAVFSATAYHWISPAGQLDRPAAILKTGGLLAIVDLVQVDSPDDHGFFAEASPIYERYGQGHAGPPSPQRGSVNPAIGESLRKDGRFADVQLHTYDWNQTYSAAEYRKLMLSYSGTWLMDPVQRAGLLDDMELLINERFNGQITRPLVVTLTTATLV
jgi:SAM-dependent methyltransferase